VGPGGVYSSRHAVHTPKEAAGQVTCDQLSLFDEDIFGKAPGGNLSEWNRNRLRLYNDMITILLIILLLMLIGALPTWPHSRNWGYYPSGGLGLILVILLILVLMGRL
jgi:hypothetical protein